ncbi:MAG: glutamate-5-semialdehyde dehydrogenase [Pseudomonadota bacterium]
MAVRQLNTQEATPSLADYMEQVGRRAKGAAAQLAMASRAQKDAALLAMAESLRASKAQLQEANSQDLSNAERNAISGAMLDRLRLTDATIEAMAVGCKQVAALEDPIGAMSELTYQPSGIQVGKMRVALGVIGIVYESRPNVTIDAAILCLKSGNAAVLRGGSESINSNLAIAECVQAGLEAAGLDKTCIQVIETIDREAVGQLITMSEYIDVIVPRGGKGLIERISDNATVPTIKHLDGNCHVYLDESADPDKAIAIAINAKTHRYGVCNAMETLLIHQGIAAAILPPLLEAYASHGLELALCDQSWAIAQTNDVPEGLTIRQADESDWETEYLAPVLAIKIVSSADEATKHIGDYSSGHTEAIVAENHSVAMKFLREVDSASVMINASTRFADGFEYGLGAEIGISTDKLHARGPVGLEGLTSQKYIVFGDGQVRG